MATQYMKDKPTAEDFAYAYAETADGALVRVPKSKVTGEGVTVDSALSETSTNPVQNKVVAEKFNELSEEFDSLEIGGRNLIPNTKSMSGWYTTANSNVALSTDNEGFTVCTWNATDALNWNSLGTRAPIQFSEVRGKTVTLSCLVRSDDYESINATGGQGFAITFALCTATSLARTLYGGINWYTTDLSDEWTKLSWTGVLDDDFFDSGTGTIDDTTCMYLQFYDRSLYSMQVKKIKLELGNVATDWSPAPEDSGYTLPIATADTLGGVKPVAKTDAMTQSVGVDANGALYTASGGGENAWELISDITLEAECHYVRVSKNDDGEDFVYSEFAVLLTNGSAATNMWHKIHGTDESAEKTTKIDKYELFGWYGSIAASRTFLMFAEYEGELGYVSRYGYQDCQSGIGMRYDSPGKLLIKQVEVFLQGDAAEGTNLKLYGRK